MRVLIVTPAPPRSRKGNRITALRWAKMLREQGHRVRLSDRFGNHRCDLLIALHARRSADSIRRFQDSHPTRPCVLALTGTDLYGDLETDSLAQQSVEMADRLILLQPDGLSRLSPLHRSKARVIYQSVKPPPVRTSLPPRDGFEVCVLGHLRDVKDPFRAARAVRLIDSDS